MIERAFRLTILEPMRVGTGVPGLLSDDTIVRVGHPDGGTVPGVPAGTLKGAVRSVAASPWAGVDDDVLRLAFGRAGTDAGTALFTDARPLDGLVPVVDEVTSVALTERRTARRGALRTVEVLRPLAHDAGGRLVPLVLEGRVRVLPGPRDTDVAAAVAVGLAGLRSLGADRSRGHGAVEVALAAEVTA